MKKKITQITSVQIPSMTERTESFSVASMVFAYLVTFDDGTSMSVPTLNSENTSLREGDEVYVYPDLNVIFRHELSEAELQTYRTGHITLVVISVALVTLFFVTCILLGVFC